MVQSRDMQSTGSGVTERETKRTSSRHVAHVGAKPEVVHKRFIILRIFVLSITREQSGIVCINRDTCCCVHQ